MINRIRDVRLEKGLTLAEVAARCEPPTTAQTIGRLETGTRTLSLGWMNRIAAALGVDPELLVKSEAAEQPSIVARLTRGGAEGLTSPREAILPTALLGDRRLLALNIEEETSGYRPGDQVWLREIAPEDYSRQMNRHVLAPHAVGRFAFGKLIECDGSKITVEPPEDRRKPVIVDSPAWLAVAEMLIRKL